MGPRTLAACVLPGVLAGCAQIAGIDDTSGLIPPERVSMTFEKISVGATVVRSPMDLTGQTATYYVPDDAEPEGVRKVVPDLDPTDTWSAEIPEGSPPLFYTLPDFPEPVLRQYEFSQRNAYVLYGRMEHPDPQPAPMGAMINLRSTLPSAYAATESFQLYTLGAWNTRGFSGAELPAVGATTFGPVNFAYSTMSSITGRPHEKIIASDAVMFLRFISSRLTGVMEAAPFDQTGTDMIMGTMTAVPANQALTVMLGPPATVAMRYAPVRPAVGAPAMSWALHAAPGHEIANESGPLLHAANVLMADSGMINVMYGNPFVAKGWPTVLTWSTSATRTYTPAGQTLPTTLAAGLYQLAEPTAGQVLDLPAGLPETITVDAKPLSSDGVTIPKPTKPVKVTFVAGITSNTAYQLNLSELVPNTANTALVTKYVVASMGTKPEFTIPAEFLVPGKIYVIRAMCMQGGFPDIAQGDLRKRELPLAVGYLDGGVFTVTP